MKYLRPFITGSALFFLLFFASCSTYRLGTGAKPSFETIYVEPVDNDTSSLPQSVAFFTTQIREALARDGRVKLVNSPENADAILKVRLSQVRRDSLLSQPQDTGVSRKFNLRLDAYATLIQNGEVLFQDRHIQANVSIFSDNLREKGKYDALIQSEYQAMPILAENLAKTLKGTILDTW